MDSWIFDELNRREFIKKTALTGAAAYLGIGSGLQFCGRRAAA